MESSRGTIYLAYAPDDAGEMEQLAAVLRSVNWNVALGPIVEAGGVFNAAISRRVDEASAVVVGWSANSVDLSRVRQEASQAFADGKLVAVRFDHASHPLADAPALDMTSRDGPPDEPFVTDFLNFVALTAAGERAAPVPVSRTVARAPTPRNRMVYVVLAGLAGLAAVALSAAAAGIGLFRPSDGSKFAASLLASADPSRQVSEAEVRWSAVAKTDPAALRKFLMEQGDSPFAAEARRTADRLEAETWNAAIGQSDAIARQTLLASYATSFKEPGSQEKAAAEADRVRRSIAEVQEMLRSQGYAVTDPEGWGLASTVAAVRAFESRSNLPATGAIDDRLLGLLNSSTSPEVLRRIRVHVQGIIFWAASPTGNSLGQPAPTQ